ncbi:TPA: hypothetical protein JLC89_001678 [Escherichia coli]|nr:hypothetical protein [Escherichia coli]SQR07760.1 Uncharacterised protein [Escherichia coli]HAV8456954.1 hypothetical protein [Escherichia coli]
MNIAKQKKFSREINLTIVCFNRLATSSQSTADVHSAPQPERAPHAPEGRAGSCVIQNSGC